MLTPVYAAVLARLAALYAPHAGPAYEQIAQRFDKAAAAFADAAALIDPASSAEVAVRADRLIQRAWRDAEILAAEQDSLLASLSSAAQLVRRLDQPASLGSNRDTLTIPLVVRNLDRLHRRAVWSAWTDSAPEPPAGELFALTTKALAPRPVHEPCRAGRWARLWAIGAQVRAAADPTSVELYRAPGPFGVRIVDGRSERFDPEDTPEDDDVSSVAPDSSASEAVNLRDAFLGEEIT